MSDMTKFTVELVIPIRVSAGNPDDLANRLQENRVTLTFDQYGVDGEQALKHVAARLRNYLGAQTVEFWKERISE